MHRTTSLQTRVAIIDDHRLVSAAIATLLTMDGKFAVVAQAEDGLSGAAFLHRDDLDVILLDLEIPRSHGLEVLRSLNGGPKVCVLTMHTEAHFVQESIQAGALGYVSKQAAPEELLQAVSTIARGESYFSADVRQVALGQLFGSNSRKLSDREREVLRLCAAGLSSSEVANKLNISKRTAESHRASFFKKLALKTQSDLVRYAIRQGLISA